MNRDILSVFLILTTSIFLSLPLARPGLHQIHDDQQVARLYLFDQSLKTGQFPVRWVEDLGFGYGYPLFIFYPPLVYMTGEIFHLVGFGFIDSIKLIFFLGIFASGIGMYILLKQLWGRMSGLVAAFFYMLIPYRAVDIYVRGALAESFSFVWLPLILWSFLKLTKTQKPLYLYLSAIFLALLMITHNLIFLPFMLLLPFYLLFLIWKSPYKKLSTVNCLLSTVLSFGLSAFFWIPALLEKKYTIVDDLLLVNLADYKIHFVALSQLWNWPWGFGGSAAGFADGISFKIGKLHILVSIAAFIFAVLHIFKNRENTKFSIFNFQFSILIFFLFLFSAFMTISYSQFIWDIVKPLAYLQFPWRFLIFTALFSSILAGTLIHSLKVPTFKLIAAVILTALLVIPNYKLFKPQSYRQNLTDQVATSKEIINWDISHSSFEYIPKGVALIKSELETNIPDIRKEDIPQHKIVIGQGKATITDLTSTPSKTVFKVDARKDTQIIANIFNFPGWTAEIDGQKDTIFDNNRYKLIAINIPEGDHSVTIEFKDTATRKAANTISLISVATLLVLIFQKQWLKKKS